MIYDKQNIFSGSTVPMTGQAITGTAVSTNVIDGGPTDIPPYGKLPVPNDWGAGKPVYLVVSVIDDFAGGTSLQFVVQTSNTENFASVRNIYASEPVPVASLKRGYIFSSGSLPDKLDRYVRLNYVVAGTMTAGSVLAGLVLNKEQLRNMGIANL